MILNWCISVLYKRKYTIYGKTFEKESFHSYKKKHFSLEKFCGLAVSAAIMNNE